MDLDFVTFADVAPLDDACAGTSVLAVDDVDGVDVETIDVGVDRVVGVAVAPAAFVAFTIAWSFLLKFLRALFLAFLVG